MHRSVPLLLTVFLLAGCAARPGPAPMGDVYDEPIADVLAKAGDNAPELAAFLEGREPGTPEGEAARFLVAGLPLADAATLTAADLAENLDYAFRAREAFPWCADMAWGDFLRFVVPHRVAQERAQPWRKRLFEALRPEILGAANASEAALAVNRWVASQAAYGPTGRVDQGPLDTMARGLGRCEELVILLVDALRAVGVAARPCGVSWWRHTDDNHVWVEILDRGRDRGRWLPLGAGEVDSRPGLAWFSPWLHTAGTVWSTAYGQVGPAVDGELAPGRGSVIVERTADYVRAGTLDVELVDAAGEPVAGERVTVAVWNYGALRPDMAKRTGSRGRCAFALGAGDYLVTAGVDGKPAWAFAEVIPGGRALVRLRIRSDLPSGPDLPAGERWMRFPADPALAARLEAEAEALRRAMAPERKEIEAEREAELRGLEVLAAACLGVDSTGDSLLETPLGLAMRATGRNILEMVRAWSLSFTGLGANGLGEDGRSVLSAMLVLMEPKDLAALKGLPLADDVEAAVAMGRVLAAKHWYRDMDAADLARFVLGSRVDREAFAHWRAPLWERFGAWLGEAGSPLDLARKVNALAAGLDKVEHFRLGPGLDPLAALRAHAVSTDQDRAVLAAALLRSLGVPARMSPGRGWVEFHDGHAWLPLYPDDPASLGDSDAARAGRRYEEPARLAVRFTRNGESLGQETVQYWRDVTLCRFDDGALAVEEDLGLDWEDGRMVMTVPPGDRVLVGGARGPDNQAFVRLEPVALGPGQRLELDLCLDVPADLEDAS